MNMLRVVELGPTAIVTTNYVAYGMARIYWVFPESVGAAAEVLPAGQRVLAARGRVGPTGQFRSHPGDFNSKRVVFGTKPSRRNISCAPSLNDQDAPSMWGTPSVLAQDTALRMSARAMPRLRRLGSTAT